MDNSSIGINYSNYYSQVMTNSDVSNVKQEENKKEILNNLIYASGAGTATIAGYNYAKNDSRVLSMVEKLPGAKLLQSRLDERFVQGSGYIDPTANPTPQPLSRSLHSMLLAAEEATPLHIAKTLGLSSFQTLFVELIDQEKQSIRIGSKSIQAYSQYYKNLILNSSGYNLTDLDVKNGFILENNKLYLSNRNGSKGREVLGYAKMISTNTKIGEQDSPNRIFQKFANIHGVNTHVSQFELEPLAIVGGQNKKEVLRDWGRAYGRFATEIGFKVLDNPFGFIEEMAGNAGIDTKNSKLFNNNTMTFLKKHVNLGLGADGVYNVGNREAMKVMAKNLGVKALGAYTTYVSANWLLENITSEDNPWHNGIGAGLSASYAKMRISAAKLWSDPLQSIRKEQEEAAPESTSISSLLALPLGGAMVGANIAYFRRMKDISQKGFNEAAKIHTTKEQFTGTLGKLLDKVHLNPNGTTLARYGKLGALVGAALTLPFVPGALIGESSEELKAKYEGTADVGVRKNRGWIFGGDPYEGGQIKYFRKSLVRELATDARNKTLYENGEQQRDMDPVFSPFKYLKNPYAFEEAHKDDMPYPVWGMEVTYGSFMGKIFQGTIGQIIKPTVVNTEFLKQVEAQKAQIDQKNVITTNTETAISIGGDGKAQVVALTPNENGQYIQTVEPQQTDNTSSNDIKYAVKESRKDVSMQKDGMMLAKPSATVDPTKEAAVGAYAAFSDFTGLKGFTSDNVLSALGIDLAEQTAPKLAVSGSANTLVDRYQSMQLGDAMGCFTPDTFVLCEDGFTLIQSIKPGDRVLSRGGKLRTVRKVFNKKFNEEILKVTLSDGSILKSTKNHIFPGMCYYTGIIEERNLINWELDDFLFKQDYNDLYDLNSNDPYGSSLLRIEKIELFWYKGTMYDLEVCENDFRSPTEHTNYYTVEGVLCHNSGEFIRRLLPQSANTKREEVNTMENSIAPSWLPKDPNRNFSEGNYYEKHEAGYTMLPGSKGFDELHPELKGIDPENYSDAWKYKILQNIARGSKEHYTYRDKLIANIGTLSEEDKDVFFTAYEQDIARNQEKRFFEYAKEDQKEGMNPLQLAQNALWEGISHLESPLEPLTPFRPMAKFLHQRTAIEDYRRTQLAGSDAAIWTKPVDHFINPTINRSIQLLDETYKPQEVEEKENVDEYFDNLKLVKAAHGRPFEMANTIVSAAYSGMRNPTDMQAFKRALPDNQKAYVESFAAEKDESKRSEILEMLPENIGRVYKTIWQNVDTYDQALKEGKDPDVSIRDLYLRETETLKKETNIQLTRQEIEGINKESYKLHTQEEREMFVAEQQAAKIRAKAAQQEANAYLEETTGKPSNDWIGWDHRLTTDDIKLKTLSIGKEDIQRFGYWDQDKQRNDRIVALDNDEQVVNQLDVIKKRLRQNQDHKDLLKRKLREQGYEVNDIESSPGSGNVTINT